MEYKNPNCRSTSKQLCTYEDCMECFQRSFASSPKAIYLIPGQCNPRMIFKQTHTKYRFVCDVCKHEFEINPHNIVNNRWCSYCGDHGLCDREDCQDCFEKSFASHPLHALWDTEKNGGKTARQVRKKLSKKFFFTCNQPECHHTFEAILSDVANCKNDRYCPYCCDFGQKKLCDDKECKLCFENSFASHGLVSWWCKKENKVKPRMVLKYSNKLFYFQCPLKHEIFQNSPNHMRNLDVCPECKSIKIEKKKPIEKKIQVPVVSIPSKPVKFCIHEDCKTRCNFNFPGQEKPIYCSIHKKEGMIDVKNIKCCEPDCQTQPSFHFPGESHGIYCSKHKKEGMINVKDKLCVHEGCNVQPSFNMPGMKKGIYCVKHKKDGMINVGVTYCQKEGCLRQGSYNYPNEKKGIYCSDHKEKDMINVTEKKCLEFDCHVSPSFNYVGEKYGIYCSKHKQEEMINVVEKKCLFDGCQTLPNFNYPDQKIYLYCDKHKLEGMVNIKNKTCLNENCTVRPSFNFPGTTSGLYCFKHKLDGMTNVLDKKCKDPFCDKTANFGIFGTTNVEYCSIHKTNEMVDIRHKKCKTYLCMIQVSSQKYDGYCPRCFSHSFPDKPISSNYKTKERTVNEFILSTFPQYSWIVDKKIEDGCSSRRPDLLVDFGEKVIIVEIDENQHTDYDSSCEMKRLNQISLDLHCRPIVYLRFNPDEYIHNGIPISSPWKLNKLGLCNINPIKKSEWNERLNTLAERIIYWTHSENKPNDLIEIEYLFYDS